MREMGGALVVGLSVRIVSVSEGPGLCDGSGRGWEPEGISKFLVGP
jgi:hypothetical protein